MTTNIFNLEGKTALITGGGTGLGQHFASVLAQAGARVVICARRMQIVQACAESINQSLDLTSGSRAEAIAMDVTDAASIEAAFDQAGAGGPIRIVVNNAGINAEPSLLKMSEEIWDQVQATNLKGSWMVAREAVRRLEGITEPGASIINIASILGVAAQRGCGPYAASKAGLLHLTRNMALEWARYKVRVNAIAPGYFASDMANSFIGTDSGKAMLQRIPQQRLGNLEDLTGAILLLASDASAYMTGSTITVDGGHSMPMT